jgi:ribonuclease Z
MVEMRIVFLGTSAAVPTATRGLSSAVITRGRELLIFDAGEGMQQNFIKSGLGINKKLKIFITHMHADHCLGVLGLLQTLSLLGREAPVDIFGPPKFARFVKANMNILSFGLIFEVRVIPIEKEGMVVKERDYLVSCCNAQHISPTYAFCVIEQERAGIFNIEKIKKLGIPEGHLYKRLQSGEDVTYGGKHILSTHVTGPKRPGRKVGISADTRPTNKLRDFFRNCDLLVFDSTYSQNQWQKAKDRMHSTASEAAILAQAAGAKKLLLTHFSARYADTMELVNEARAFHNNVEAAEDMRIVEIPYLDSKDTGATENGSA